MAARAVVDAHLAAPQPAPGRIHAIDRHGSLALGANEETTSDIDLVVTDGVWSASETACLGRMHERLGGEHPMVRRLDVAYQPRRDLGKGQAEAPPHPVIRDGQSRPVGSGDPNAVAWWLAKHHGIRLL